MKIFVEKEYKVKTINWNEFWKHLGLMISLLVAVGMFIVALLIFTNIIEIKPLIIEEIKNNDANVGSINGGLNQIHRIMDYSGKHGTGAILFIMSVVVLGLTIWGIWYCKENDYDLFGVDYEKKRKWVWSGKSITKEQADKLLEYVKSIDTTMLYEIKLKKLELISKDDVEEYQVEYYRIGPSSNGGIIQYEKELKFNFELVLGEHNEI